MRCSCSKFVLAFDLDRVRKPSDKPSKHIFVFPLGGGGLSLSIQSVLVVLAVVVVIVAVVVVWSRK